LRALWRRFARPMIGIRFCSTRSKYLDLLSQSLLLVQHTDIFSRQAAIPAPICRKPLNPFIRVTRSICPLHVSSHDSMMNNIHKIIGFQHGVRKCIGLMELIITHHQDEPNVGSGVLLQSLHDFCSSFSRANNTKVGVQDSTS
jgi:hypothetical protein